VPAAYAEPAGASTVARPAGVRYYLKDQDPEMLMRLLHLTRSTLVLAAIGACGLAHAQRHDAGPLRIEQQGSFFVGGETRALPPPAAGAPFGGGEITVNQMYVQYQIPPRGSRHVPVVMVHGCCLSSKTWETTPDGRMGWDEYFVRRDRAVYLADQVSRARSGFDPTIIAAVRTGASPPSALPNIISASHQIGWTVFRFGPSYPNAFPDTQFPIEAVDELYKQMIPDLNALLPTPNPTWTNMAALAKQLDGAVLMGHSESGFFPEEAALIDPSGVAGMISIEQQCRADLSAAEIATLAGIPTLMMFGDHLDDMPPGGIANWQASFDGCQAYVDRINAAGGDAQMMHLPALGIAGNSHMLMQDRNNLELADLILDWLDEHVESD
jgi:pimeloyl-ACP methyl ester carboxylesterase